MAAMSSLKLPLGFRFRPTEVEIIDFYLRSKITGINDGELGFIPVVDFFKQEPWELPGDPFFFFFLILNLEFFWASIHFQICNVLM
jgi:hypothetical protein